MKFLIKFLATVGTLLLMPFIIPGVTVSEWKVALLAALVLGVVNLFIRPLIKIFTLPITILTLGLFSLVINALLFWVVAYFVPGFEVAGFVTAFWGALLLSVMSWIINILFKK